MLNWLITSWHKVIVVTTQVTLVMVHYEDLIDRFKTIFKMDKLIERRGKHTMNLLEIPTFVQDVVKLAKDVQSAEAVLAPQFPQLVADAKKVQADAESLLGLSTPPPFPAA